MKLGRLAGQALGLLVSGYQIFLSPLLPRACRFEPSCSEYFRQALTAHGPLRATWLAFHRISRCHPWHAGGYDPPPPAGRLLRDEPRR